MRSEDCKTLPLPVRLFTVSVPHKTCTKQIHPVERGSGHPTPSLVLTEDHHIYIVLLCRLIPGKTMERDVS